LSSQHPDLSGWIEHPLFSSFSLSPSATGKRRKAACVIDTTMNCGVNSTSTALFTETQIVNQIFFRTQKIFQEMNKRL
jgi:hypothetical protein